jgi:hypothetical protein
MRTKLACVVKLPVFVSVMLLLTLPLLAQAPAQGDAGRGRAGGRGNVEGPSTTVNLGGGSNWRGVVPTGPVPRLPDGTIDLAGVWQGGGPSANIQQGLPKGETVPLLPAARKQMESRGVLDNTEALCLPAGVPRVPSSYPWRLVQSPTHKKATHIFMIFEGNIHSFRQIFMDGRKHPADLDLTWYGHSIGRWEGDTLIVDTIGFNGRNALDGAGHPRTDKMHIIERWTRKDLGHMENVITIDDPGAYSRPFNVTFQATLRVGDELMEYICNENNQVGVAGGYLGGK